MLLDSGVTMTEQIPIKNLLGKARYFFTGEDSSKPNSTNVARVSSVGVNMSSEQTKIEPVAEIRSRTDGKNIAISVRLPEDFLIKCFL